MITGYTKVDFDDYSKDEIQSTINAYKDYKKQFKFPRGFNFRGLTFDLYVIIIMIDIFKVMNGKTNCDM